MKTPHQIAETFGVPVANVQRQFAKNARQLRGMEAQAGAGKVSGYTAGQLATLAVVAESQAVAISEPFTVSLSSVGNPDFGQYAPLSDPSTVIVSTLREAAQECRKYIRTWNLGGGNWPKTFIVQGGQRVARVSYNGRLWDMAGNEINA